AVAHDACAAAATVDDPDSRTALAAAHGLAVEVDGETGPRARLSHHQTVPLALARGHRVVGESQVADHHVAAGAGNVLPRDVVPTRLGRHRSPRKREHRYR